MSALPVVAVVGRPNVGKSTLVNRIVGRREAIVEERPGVTRDRREIEADWSGRSFLLVDTGGWMPESRGQDRSLNDKVSEQSLRAMLDADVVLFVTDGRIGLTGDDEEIATVLRQRKGPVLVVANKLDAHRHDAGMWELLGLGMGDPYPASALHGRGVADLLDEIVTHFGEFSVADPEQPEPEEPDEPRTLGVAIVGRPNVGKSTLFNQLIGSDRSVVHDQPGTTRDSIDTVVATGIGDIRFIDTAGMRRRGRIDSDTEYYSMVRALKSVDKADVALLVIDATVGVTHQDQRLAERVDVAGCPVVVVLNKWDLVDTEQRLDLATQLERKIHFLGDVPVLRMSALSGKGVQSLMPTLAGTIDDYHTRIPTREVNRVMRQAQSEHPAPGGARVLYAIQGASDPPTFTLFANRKLPQTYLRYLERRIREEFNLASVPIKLRVRRRSE